jgi:hypothetical protein
VPAITVIRAWFRRSRLVPTLAPEMEFKNNGAKSAIDEYFEKFRAAGLKVGVCIRPQQIVMVDDKPVHHAAEDEHWSRCFRKDRLREAAMGLHTFLCGFNRDRGRLIRTFLNRSRTRIPMSC